MTEFKCVNCGLLYHGDTLMSSCPKCCAQNWCVREKKSTDGIGMFVGLAITLFVLAAIVIVKLEGLM